MDDSVEEERSAPEVSDHVTLPVGVDDGTGTRFREVVVDEMSGIDDELVSGKKSGGNGAKGLSLVLCRCIQSIEGLVEQKKNSESLIDRQIVRRMTQADRDYLVSRIFMLGGADDAVMQGKCPRCETSREEEVFMSDLQVVRWPDDKPPGFEFELPVGYRGQDGKLHRKGWMDFPTGAIQENIATLKGALIITAMLTACIKRLGSLETVDQEIVKRFKSRDRRYLMDELKFKAPGLRQWKEVTCSECDKAFDIRVDMSSFFDSRR